MTAKTDRGIAGAIHAIAELIERGKTETRLCRYCGDEKHPNRNCNLPPFRGSVFLRNTALEQQAETK